MARDAVRAGGEHEIDAPEEEPGGHHAGQIFSALSSARASPMGPVAKSMMRFCASVRTGAPAFMRSTGSPRDWSARNVSPCPKGNTSSGTARRVPMRGDHLPSSTMKMFRREA